jgi:hypothetical protein
MIEIVFERDQTLFHAKSAKGAKGSRHALRGSLCIGIGDLRRADERRPYTTRFLSQAHKYVSWQRTGN